MFSDFSCAFLAGVSAKYVLLIHPIIMETLQATNIGFDWTVKLVAVGLMCRYFYISVIDHDHLLILVNGSSPEEVSY